MTPISFRSAQARDLPAILALMVDDALGTAREDLSLPLDPRYRAAFDAIEIDPQQVLIVGEQDGEVVATAQVSYLPGLSNRGQWRALVEAVRVATRLRGHGIGGELMAHVIELARARGCGMVQLTSNKSRTDAHRFYRRLGFAMSHEGFKLKL